MNNSSIIENEKRVLLTNLPVYYSDFSLETISSISDTLELYLKEFTTECLRRYSSEFLSLRLAEDEIFFLDDSGNFYEVSLADDVKNSDCLLIVISVRGNTRQYILEDFDFSLSESFGKYQSFNITYPKKLRLKPPELQSLITVIFETGYKWFFEKTVDLAKNEENKLGYQLYEFAGTVIHSKTLLNNLWFGSITEGFGFRLLNESVTRESFNIFNRSRNKFKQSVNTFVAELLNTKLPEAQLLMIHAIKEKGPIDANLKEATYAKTDSLYAATLKALYGQNQFTVYPVFESDKICVVGLFETKNKTELIPILERHKAELDEVCKSSVGGIKSLLAKLKTGTKGVLSMIWGSAEVKPGIFGVKFDLKKIFGYFTKKYPKN